MEMERTKYKEVHEILLHLGYRSLKSIGRGGYGEVFVAHHEKTQTLYAIKVLNKAAFKSKPFLKKYVMQQIDIMKNLNHPNIVRLFDSFQSEQFSFLVLEYCRQGNLIYYQAGQKNKVVNFNNALDIVIQILKGLKYIHEKGYIHRDIKPENILTKSATGSTLLYKIADFGFARPIGKIGARTQCGTEKYMSPQIISNQQYGIEADLWALAVLFYFMLFFQYPFVGHDMKSDIKRKCSPEFCVEDVINKKQNLENCTDMISDFFKRVFIFDKTKRIKFSQLLDHPIFSPYKGYPDFKNYKEVYSQLQSNQTYYKDEVLHIPEQFQSEMEPEDESRVLLLEKVKECQYQNNAHLQYYIAELQFQIKKVVYLKECAYQMFQNYSRILTYSERLGAKFSLLQAFLYFCDPLLKCLQSKQQPQGFKQLKVNDKTWRQVTVTEQYKKMLHELQQEHLKGYFDFQQTYENVEFIIKQMPFKNFNQNFSRQFVFKSYQDFKFAYRSVTIYLFQKIRNCKGISEHLRNKIKMRIFCCHMIKKIFERGKIDRHFPLFKQWLKKSGIKYKHSFQFNHFKRWILEQKADNLHNNIMNLHQLL